MDGRKRLLNVRKEVDRQRDDIFGTEMYVHTYIHTYIHTCVWILINRVPLRNATNHHVCTYHLVSE